MRDRNTPRYQTRKSPVWQKSPHSKENPPERLRMSCRCKVRFRLISLSFGRNGSGTSTSSSMLPGKVKLESRITFVEPERQ